MPAYLLCLLLLAAGCSLYVDDYDGPRIDDGPGIDAGPTPCSGVDGDPCVDDTDCGSSICVYGVCTRHCMSTPDGPGLCGLSADGDMIRCSATQPFTTGACLFPRNECVLPPRDAGTD